MDRRGSKAGERRDADTASAATNDQIAQAAARGVFARWLRDRREARGQTIADVARVTRIQLRTLERLEGGRFEELPADVFVRGFIRNYARCVGIDADDALARYGDCGVAPAPRSVSSLEAQALLDQIAALAPAAAPTVASESSARILPRVRASGVQPVVEPPPAAAIEAVPVLEAAPVIEAAPAVAPATKGRRRNARQLAEGTAAPGTHPVVGSKASRKRRNRKNKQAAVAAAAASAPALVPEPQAESQTTQTQTIDDLEVEIEIVATPAPAPAPVRASRRIPVVAAPALTIDDDDPDAAERAREAREPKEPSRRSFLPPILLDEERSGRQGGLTLAVIILLIVATLTLSYLMRRPSSSGEGVSARDVPARVYS